MTVQAARVLDAGELAAMPAPKFATARTPGRPTLGTRQGEFARIWLGAPFMPWQQLVADVAGELNPDGTPAYPLVVITLPRQAGKSHLSLAGAGERCLTVPRFRSWYTAQTGADARDQFLKFADEVVDPTPLRSLVRVLRGNGHEAMHWLNGSTIRPHPPTEAAMHGKQSDRSDVDEAWAFDLDEGRQLLQAIAPTQLTRPAAQTWIWSAGGTARSTWLSSLVARGRAGDPSMCYFEWGIPDDLALDDLEAIAAHHPAYGHTIGLQQIRNLRSQLEDDSEFARAAGNRWTEAIGGAITAADWEAVRTTEPIPEDSPVGFGAARAADGSMAAIAAAGVLPDGRIVAELLDVTKAHGAAAQLASWAQGGLLAVAPAGPSRPLADELERDERTELLTVSDSDYGAACAVILDALPARAILYRPHPDLDAAVQVLGVRRIGDGGRAFARTANAAPVAPMEAVTLAVWALRHRPTPAPKPMAVAPR